jgi:hypothetical protein
MTDTLHIPEFAHGYLLSQSYMILHDVLEGGATDEDWQQINDVL